MDKIGNNFTFEILIQRLTPLFVHPFYIIDQKFKWSIIFTFKYPFTQPTIFEAISDWNLPFLKTIISSIV